MSNETESHLSDVQAALTGFVKTFPNMIYYKNLASIRRKLIELEGRDVKLITGGGSGHEPAHVGYIGEGMLHAAICGDIFASPSVDKILNTILLTASPGSDILMIVKNYTGDRLNFGLAIEVAKLTYGYKSIKVLLVDDDCSIDQADVKVSVGRRGLAGTVLVHKIAGAMSAKHCSIDKIYETCHGLLERRQLVTLGFTFSSTMSTLTKIEVGKGIHGEPGVMTIESSDNFDEVIEVCLEKFEKCIPSGAEVVVMVNNLGGTSLHLVNVFTLALLEKFENFGYQVVKILTGCFLSSLGQEGLSVTLLDLSSTKDELLGYLNYPVNVPAGLFNSSDRSADSASVIDETATFVTDRSRYPEFGKYIKVGPLGVEISRQILTFVCEALISCEAQLNLIDSELGDGDTGTSLAKGAAAIQVKLNTDEINLEYPGILLQNLATIVRMSMGGTSGAMYALFLQAAATSFTNALKNVTPIDRLQTGIRLGVQTVAKYGLSRAGDRTMLDALLAGEQALQQASGKGPMEILEAFTVACEQGAAATVKMQPRSGRSAYSGTKNLNLKHPDPGAHAVGIWCRAMFEAVKFTLAKFMGDFSNFLF